MPQTREIFERMASGYDTEDRVSTARRIADEIRASLPDTRKKRALDYGCGTGLVGLALAELFETMLLVDASPQMIARVQDKITSADIANASVLCADFMTDIPQGLRADWIIVSQVLLHVKAYPLLLARLYSLLDDGGHLLVVDFDKNEAIESELVHPGFDQAELAGLLRRTGFARVASRTFYHGEKLFMRKDASLFLLDAAK